MRRAQTSVTANTSGRKTKPSPIADAVPTSTGTAAAGSVAGRAATTHGFTACDSRIAREFREIRRTPFEECVLTLFRFFGQVVEQGCVARELLKPGKAISVCVECRLEKSDRHRALLEDLTRPLNCFFMQALERHHCIDESH